MEQIDIYDKNGVPTGAVRDKDAPLGPEEYRMAVGIWIVDKSGRIFLTRRSLKKKYAPGKWENPAGHVRAGEPPVHAVVRELHEETGLAVTEEQITLLGSSCFWPYLGRDYGVRMEVELDQVRFQKGETCGARWASFAEFVQMAREGAFAPSLTDHLQDYREAFLNFIGRPKSRELDFLMGEDRV
ncbi:NUDIX hydrolase [Acutalibacter intestini]|uniref:NUDIX hydrolase n=1 Tax=Acutalibacter intestini TaxID=3093659 RepID=UPI002AC8AEB0|nr:NUDIX domain-containing protein [Acutalibacter sp. M00204]